MFYDTVINRNITYWASELLGPLLHLVCGAERDGEIVDNLNQTEQILFLHQLQTSRLYQEVEQSSMRQRQTLGSSSRKDLEEEILPSWWFQHFEPVWKPFIQRLRSQKNVSLFEFEQATSHVPGLTHIEKTIAISAFRQQHERGLVPSRNTTAFRGEHRLSAV